MRSYIFDRISFFALFVVIALLPLFFLPFAKIPVETSKGLLLVMGLTVSLIFWGFGRFFDGKIIVPRSYFLLGGLGIIIISFLSAAFSKVPEVSFFGTMFDMGTFWFIFAGLLLMLMSAIIFREPKNARVVLLGVILSSAVILLFQSLRFLFPAALSLGVLAEKTDNLVGSWNSFGIFAGFSTLVALFAVEFFATNKIGKWMLGALIALSLVLVAAVNFPLTWMLLGISSLIIFVYKISVTSRHHDNGGVPERRMYFPAFSFAVMMVSLLFFMVGSFIGGILPSKLGLVSNEVKPSFESTMIVARSVIKENPALGIGPNKFGEAWAMYKPVSVNSTAFWNVAFDSGSGLLPTFASTGGVLGILAWLVFLVLFVTTGAKSFFYSIKSGENWEAVAFFTLSSYLFISSFFYSGTTIFILALAFAGVFAGLSSSAGKNREISLSFLNDHKTSFFSILFIVLVIIISAGISFKYIGRLASVSYFSRALSAQTVPEAENSIKKALTLHVNDLYLRTYSQIYLIKLNSLVGKGGQLSDAEKADLQASLDQAISGAESATAYNSQNYLNFQALGSVYQTAASLGVSGAEEKAVEAYKQASLLNPGNPGLKLAIAAAYKSLGNIAEAKSHANAALSLKPDYIDALIFLSETAKAEGDTAGALVFAETALSFFPFNEDLINYVNSLKNPGASLPETPTDQTEGN